MAVGFLLLNGRTLPALGILSIPICFIIVAIPRLSIVLYVVSLFVFRVVFQSPHVLLIDVAGFLLLMSAVVDYLVRNNLPKRLPVMSGNFFALLIAVCIAAAFSYDPTLALRPIIRLLFLISTFMAVYHLSKYLSVGFLLRLYFWLCVVQSAFVLGPFIASSGQLRSFGLAPAIFDELSMVALPLGVAIFLWSPRGSAMKYLLGSGVVLLGLIATQSRAPIIFGLMGLGLTLIVASRKARQISRNDKRIMSSSMLKQQGIETSRRVKALIFLGTASVVMVMLFSTELFDGVVNRFASLLSGQVGETFALRLFLWKTALQSFLDNPLVGLGPGMFDQVREVYPTIHLDPRFTYVRGYSAHNLLLHYMAETGIVGAAAMFSLFLRQYWLSRKVWMQVDNVDDFGISLALYGVSAVFLISVPIDAPWMWGQFSYISAFFLGLVARYSGDHWYSQTQVKPISH